MKKILLTVLLMVFGLTVSAADNSLLGAGATFPYPLYSKMFSEYNKQFNMKINYQAIGSGGGVRQIAEKTVDFGASDAFLNDEKLAKFEKPIVHIPMVSGSVVLVYNLPGVNELKLTPEVLANIFLGKTTKWNDSSIKEINKGIEIPSMPISVVHRSDGSGTTSIFSDYISKISSEWKTKVGAGKSLNWPAGLGGKGNAGVAGMVKQIPGGIGYIEYAYAHQNNMTVALLKNSAGNYIAPSLESVSLAADVTLPADMRISLTNSDAEKGYPIVGFTYLLVYKDLSDGNLSKEKAVTLKKLINWMVHEGQKYATALDYAPLSANALKNAEMILDSLNYKGEKLN